MAHPKDSSLTFKPSVSSEVELDTAEGFLKSNGFEDLIPILVVKNKFQAVDDLRLLGSNVELAKSLELPLCSVLKLINKLQAMEKEKEEKTPCAQQPEQEIKSKKQLLELQKTEISAQAANHAWNKFNSLISNKVKALDAENKWKGSGGLRACAGTTDDDSKNNLALCNRILNDPDITSLFGVYRVKGTGIVKLDKGKGRMHISNIMCSMRKPTAYQKQASRKGQTQSDDLTSDGRKRASKNKRKESNESVPEKIAKLDGAAEASKKGQTDNDDLTSNGKQRASKNERKGEDLLNDSGVVEAESDDEGVQDISDYERRRLESMKSNELQLLETGFVGREQAIMVSLHYLKGKTISSVTMTKLKTLCKDHCIPVPKHSKKEDLLRSLGQILFEKKNSQAKE